MNNNMLEYKGYHTRVEFDAQSMVLHGKIEGIVDLVCFEAENASEIENEFHSAVDDYLIFCEEQGKSPDKEYKGTFNVRMSSELHKALAMYAYRNNMSLNQIVVQACEAYCNKKPDQTTVNVYLTNTTETSDNRSVYQNEKKLSFVS